MDNLFSFGKKEDFEGKKQVLAVLQALRDGEKTNGIVCNLQGIDREIADVINEIISKHQTCAAEMTHLAKEVEEGREARVKVDHLHGTWLDILGSADQIVRTNSEQLHQFNVLTQAVANGDFSKKIWLDMKGQSLELKNTLNSLVDFLNCIASEIILLANDTGCEGKFGGQLDVQGAFGTWQDITESLNTMSTNVGDQMHAIKRVATGWTQGDFSKKVRLDVKGEAQELKDTLNNFVDFLNLFASEVVSVLHGISNEGQLGLKVDAPEYEGSWKDLVESVNTLSQYIAAQLQTLTITVKGITEHRIPTTFAQLNKVLKEIAVTHLNCREFRQNYQCMHHEIRTPLNGIIGICELLLDKFLNQEQYQFVYHIRQCGTILLDILNDYVDYDRVHDTHITVNEQQFCLRRTCENVIFNDMQYKPFSEGLNFEIDPEVPECLFGDNKIFTQIILNWINFIIKRNFNRFDILVSIKQKSIKGDIVTLEVRISDHIGIFTEYNEEKLLEMPTGIVPITLRLIQLMNGQYKVESSNKSFSFTIPFKLDSTKTVTEYHELCAALVERKIFVVCSRASLRESLARMIAGAGLIPATTSSAGEALKILQNPEEGKSDFFAILIDCFDQKNHEVVTFAKQYYDAQVVVISRDEWWNDVTRIQRPLGIIRLLTALSTPFRPAIARTESALHVIEPPAQNQNARILCAAQNEIMRKLNQRLLTRFGYTNVTIVEKGSDALKELDKHEFDIILLDSEDSIETARVIRSRDKDIPIIGMRGTRDECLAVGMNEKLTKPVNAIELRDKLLQFIRPKEVEGGFVLVDKK